MISSEKRQAKVTSVPKAHTRPVRASLTFSQLIAVYSLNLGMEAVIRDIHGVSIPGDELAICIRQLTQFDAHKESVLDCTPETGQ